MRNNKGFKSFALNSLPAVVALLMVGAMPAYPQVIKKAVWSSVKMDAAYDVPQKKGAKSAKAAKQSRSAEAAKQSRSAKMPSAAETYNAAMVIDGHRATSPALLKPVGKCEVDLNGERLYGFVLDQMMDYATSRLTMSAKSARAKKAAEASRASGVAESAKTTGAAKPAGATDANKTTTGAANDLLVKADLAIVCFRSPQACIPAGDVTPADIMDLLPFDNQTIVLHLEGKYVRELLRHAAQIGAVTSLEAGAGTVGAGTVGAGAAETAGTGAGVETGAAADFDDDRVYKVVTIDYLLRGEVGANLMKQAQKLDNYNMPLCNTLIQNIKKLAQRGETIK